MQNHEWISSHRLIAREWRSVAASDREDYEVVDIETNLLIAPATTLLPESWQGGRMPELAKRSIGERDAEDTTLLVFTKPDRQPIESHPFVTGLLYSCQEVF